MLGYPGDTLFEYRQHQDHNTVDFDRCSKMKDFSDTDVECAVAPFVKDGKVRLCHLGDVFKKLDLDMTKEEIKEAMKSNHFNEGDELKLADFQSLASRVGHAKLCKRQMVAEFRKHDLNGDGFISKEEAKTALEKEGVHLSEEDFDVIMKAVDLDGDGQVNYEEFARFASIR